MSKKKSILILCTGNSARSQMAEALLKHICNDRYDVYSAGTHPSIVRKEAIAAIGELGLSMDGYRSESVDEFTGKEIDFVLTVCDNAKESCPHFPAKTKVIHRSFDDPAAVKGSYEKRLSAFVKST